MSETTPAGPGAPADEPYAFVSYARADEKQAKSLIALLKGAGISVWWDGLIPGGERFSARIAEALEQSRAVVVLWSRHSLESNWVQDEAAWGRDRSRLVPLSLDGSEPPLGFRQLQCIDLSKGGLKPGNPQVQRAIDAVCDLIGREPVALAGRGAGPRVSRRALMAGGAAVVLAAGGLGAWRFLGGGSAAANTIAVLPFANIGGDPAKAYLADGLSAELRSTLSRNAELRVVGQASSANVGDTAGDSRRVAAKLNVANLLAGNVLAAGNMVRIGVELIDGSNGFTRWSQKFERPMDDVLKLQDEIAQSIDSALALRLTNLSGAARGNGGTRNVAAFDAYLRGKELFDAQKDEASDRAALAAFTDALQIDPHYGAARAARSRSLAVIANSYDEANRRSLYDDAIAEARKAVADAPQFADAHAALGYGLFYGKLDILAAEAPYEKAREFGSGSADVLGLYAIYNSRLARFDRAIPAIDRAISLDPINPTQYKNRGRIEFAQGNYDEAIAGARRSIELNPAIGASHGDMGNALLMQGKLAEAKDAFGREKVALLTLPGLAMIAAREGRTDDARAALAELIASQGENGLYQQAQVLAQMGEGARALDALDKAAAANDSGLVYLLIDPFLEPVRDQPRFKALLRRFHFV